MRSRSSESGRAWLLLASIGASAGFAGFAATRAPPTPLTRLDIAAPPAATPKQSENLLQPLPYSRPPRVPSEYDLNLGTAIDTLRRDYPKLFVEKPDLSIFNPNVELFDPSGKRLQGVAQYERVFDMLRFLRRTTMQDAELTYRIVCHDQQIRVRWCAKMQVRDPALGFTQLNVIDGVSVYELDSAGKIRKHKIETIVMANPDMMQPVNLGLLWPTTRLATPDMAIPFFRNLDAALAARAPPTRTGLPLLMPPPRGRRAGYPQASALSGETPMAKAAREREEDAEKARALAELRAPKKEKKSGWPLAFKKPQECETSYDCDAPMVCCDLIVASVCCSGGLKIPQASNPALQRQAIPIPVDRDSPFPPGVPGGGSTPPQYPNGF